MAENKTRPTDVPVADYLDALEPARRRAEARELCAIMARATGQPPCMWGPSMIGFGSYRYRHAGGREGDMFRVGFAPRKGRIVLYLAGDLPRQTALLAKLGQVTTGVSCVYVKTLEAVDRAVLEALVRDAWAHMAAAYPDA